MPASIQPRPSSSVRAKPQAAIPRFRELRLSAVVAACASPKRKDADLRKGTSINPPTRFEEG